MSKRGGRITPSDMRRDHTWTDEAGLIYERAPFTCALAAEAADRITGITSRPYKPYRCRSCNAWHIRPCRRGPADLARPA